MRLTPLLLLVLALPAVALAARGESTTYLEQLQQTASEQKLAEQRAWRFLLHAHEGPERRHSRVDDPAFFLAPNGKTDPAAELQQTLGGLFRPADTEDHPQCRFPARYHWLQEELGIDAGRLPSPDCSEFIQWRDSLDAAGATLIFPAAYLNNPSSMYGHTLLRLDREDQTPQTRMLSDSVNFAADPGDDGGFAFAFKGLTGFYPGTFSLAPYHRKITQYNDMESRDIWEYSLDLSRAEVARMVRHLWELRGIRFDYYFFSENCSSQLLALMEVARPELALSEEFGLWAIPVDTVRAIRRAGLIEETEYRPALATRVRERARALDRQQAHLARACSRAPSLPASELDQQSPEAAARILDLAYLDLRHRYHEGTASRQALAQRGHELLTRRARHEAEGFAARLPPPAIRPDEGHGSARVALGVGRRAGEDFQSLRLRPVYHDILDPEGGFVPGARINFADLTLRRYAGRGERDARVELDQLTLIDMVSLAPRGPFIKGTSWRVESGYHRYPVTQSGDRAGGPGVWRTRGGAGLAWALGPARPYFFAESALDLGGGLDHNWGASLGGRAGLYLDTGADWRWNLEASALRFEAGTHTTETRIRLRGRYALGHNHALRWSVGRTELFHTPTERAELAWHVYF